MRLSHSPHTALHGLVAAPPRNVCSTKQAIARHRPGMVDTVLMLATARGINDGNSLVRIKSVSRYRPGNNKCGFGVEG